VNEELQGRGDQSPEPTAAAMADGSKRTRTWPSPASCRVESPPRFWLAGLCFRVESATDWSVTVCASLRTASPKQRTRQPNRLFVTFTHFPLRRSKSDLGSKISLPNLMVFLATQPSMPWERNASPYPGPPGPNAEPHFLVILMRVALPSPGRLADGRRWAAAMTANR